MGGFVKGMVVGVLSFVLGFAVLSVVFPVEEPATPEPPPAAVAASDPGPPEVEDAVTPAAPSVTAPPDTDAPVADGRAADVPASDAAPVAVAPGADPAGTVDVAGAEPRTAPSLSGESAPGTQPEPAAPQPTGDQPAATAPSAEQVTPAAPDVTPAPAVAAPEVTPAPAPVPPVQAEAAATEPPEPSLAPVQDGATEPPADQTTPADDPPSAPDAPATPDAAAVPVAPAPAADPAAGQLPAADADPEAEPPAVRVPAAPEPVPEPAPEPVTPSLPRVQTMPSGDASVAVRRGGETGTTPGFGGAVDGVTVGRLPRIGAPVAAEAPGESAEPAPEPAPEPAWRRNAARVDLPAGMRPLGVVLFDAPDAEAALVALPVAVTVAIDPFDADAPRRAAAYRLAGHEIALLARNIPPLATPADIAVTLDAWQRTFPEAMGVMDVLQDPLSGSRSLARYMALGMQGAGLAAISRRGGLDAFLQAAQDADLPAAGLYRTIDDAGQSETVMRRLIDRAAFETGRSAGILIAGSAANPDTLAVIAGWSGADVVLAPASRVLTQE